MKGTKIQYKCEICDKVFETRLSCDKHVEKHIALYKKNKKIELVEIIVLLGVAIPGITSYSIALLRCFFMDFSYLSLIFTMLLYIYGILNTVVLLLFFGIQRILIKMGELKNENE